MSTFFCKELYPIVEKSLSDNATKKRFKEGIDQFLATNIDKLTTSGPSKYVVFPQSEIDKLIQTLGLDQREISRVGKLVKQNRNLNTDYSICTNPLHVSLSMATRYFTIEKDKCEKKKDTKRLKECEIYLKCCMYYTSIAHYGALHKGKYFKKCEPNDAIMQYAISQMIEKNRIRQTGNILETIYITTEDCYKFYAERMLGDDDDTFVRYVNDVRTRLNSIMKNISRAYYDAFEKKQYLRSETEDLSDDNYYQADSNSQYISRTTDKVVQSLIVNGPDMRLIEFSARNNHVSVSDLRSYVVTICTEKQMEDLRKVIESLLILFFSLEEAREYSPADIGTNKFVLFAVKIYKKSNTRNEHIVRIKSILDKWIKELHVLEKSGTESTVNNHRRAIYIFIAFSIAKVAR